MSSCGWAYLVVLLFCAFVVHGCGGGGGGYPLPQAVAVATPPADDLRLAAVGDILLDRGPGDAIAANGAASILPVVADQLRAADIAFANLECPLATVGPHDPANVIFRADPATVAVLTLGGFDIVSLANNHAMDAGEVALTETLGHLDDAGIRYVGAAVDPSHASDPTFLTAKGLRVGFLAYDDISDPSACESMIGTDMTSLRAQVTAAKAGCDVLLVSMHWGVQDTDTTTARQRDVAHACIEAGADAILGHHPHVLQGMELYRGRPILYSMGDFVFDARSVDEAQSGIFELYRAADGSLQVWMTPVSISTTRMGPEYATGAERDAILARFIGLSRNLGTTVQRTTTGKAFLQGSSS